MSKTINQNKYFQLILSLQIHHLQMKNAKFGRNVAQASISEIFGRASLSSSLFDRWILGSRTGNYASAYRPRRK